MAYAVIFALLAAELPSVHKQLLTEHSYISDIKQYGVEDYWKRSLIGDCEDFALTAYFRLVDDNYRPEFWLVRVASGEMHATVVVNGYVFDNIKLQKVKYSGYKFITEIDKATLERYW